MIKRALLLFVAAGMLLGSGCTAIQEEDFLALQSLVVRNQRKINDIDRRLSNLTTRLDDITQSQDTLTRQQNVLSQRQNNSGTPTASILADISALRREVAALQGRLEDTDHQLGRLQQTDPGAARQAEMLSALQKRLDQLEKYLGFSATGQPPQAKPAEMQPKPQPVPQAPTTAKGIYNLGVELAKQKSYDAARTEYEKVLQKFSGDRVYAPAAQYQIGETYYRQGKFEEAILAYNQVVKRFAKSSKVPSALLKQGLAFKSLGDKRTANIVLNKLIKSYPRSSQAKAAKKTLKNLK